MAAERRLPEQGLYGRFGPSVLVLAGLVCQNLGAAFAKSLFAQVGALGATALRVTLAALLLCIVTRAWRRRMDRRAWAGVIAYGLVLGLMNILIYQAIARIPIGVAVAIELTGPLAVALLGARRAADALLAVLAAAGLSLLLPVWGATSLDPAGLAFALGAAVTWAGYILIGARVAGAGGGAQTVALGLLVATLLTAPLGLYTAGLDLLRPEMLAGGLALAVLSSAAPYTLEMLALRTLSARLFGLLVCAAPAIAALLGWLVLGERLAPRQGLAIVLITFACLGGAAIGREAEHEPSIDPAR